MLVMAESGIISTEMQVWHLWPCCGILAAVAAQQVLASEIFIQLTSGNGSSQPEENQNI